MMNKIDYENSVNELNKLKNDLILIDDKIFIINRKIKCNGKKSTSTYFSQI